MIVHVSSTSPAGDSQRSNNPANANGAASFMPMWIGCLVPDGRLLPFVEAVGRKKAAMALERGAKRRLFGERFRARVDHPIADRRILGPARHEAPADVDEFALSRRLARGRSARPASARCCSAGACAAGTARRRPAPAPLVACAVRIGRTCRDRALHGLGARRDRPAACARCARPAACPSRRRRRRRQRRPAAPSGSPRFPRRAWSP